ncbi:glycerophosphodiester phosphodiesterase [Clostridium botulinum]|uniref:glycerophosphodiester phosphodiesterase n=1 Tax=Clostridium botulinum TaxID=1491 RepID=UPI0002F72316|nr:glycerophosphodiester phosphodiesterase [Clostridium botulinum]KEH96835.1 glycerophosphodiester phosphodiesterase [Clostridium botulinum D str. 16868]KLU74514.1 glycerophosphodiester phosphodiesterase [Clostridium botulinum V891]KOA73656.1 glycerophosphodiester phosphodiesterase [Clostridium botulinum]KOA89279.1 glycerophosphodiester phosphodiesterase [Clostridium botulinum]KOC32407.1 glycerophosphodiester phosphodiesterase [Clostridium botulinum]
MKKTKLLAIVIASFMTLGAVGCTQANKTKTTASTSDTKSTNKTIIAHRGASGYLPEHTLEAYSLAYGLGADYIEADVCLTKDGVPIVMHDIHLDTTTNVAKIFPDRKRKDGRYYIIDFTLDEIKKLSVNERVDLKTNEAVFKDRFPLHKSHFEVPTLEEEIQLIQGLNKSTGKNVGIYPELKNPKFHTENGQDIGSVTLKILDKYGYNNKDSKCYLQCFDPTYLKYMKNKLKTKCKIVQLIGLQSWEDNKDDNVAQMLSKEGLKEMSKYADGIGPWYGQILNNDGKLEKSEDVTNPTLVADAHEAGLVVHPYTVRKDELPKYAKDADSLLRKLLFEANVDGLFTDFTDLGVKAVKEGPLK